MKQPILDIATRWNSSYNMLNRLLELKEFCKEIEESNADVKLSDSVWDGIKLLCEALEPFNDSTIKIQNQQLTLGDFYGEWIRCRSRVSSINSSFSIKLLAQMKKREEKILKNEVLITAVLMDPRFSFLLNSDEIRIGVRHLTHLHYAINNNFQKNVESKITVTTTSPLDSDVEDVEENDLEKLLKDEERKKITDRPVEENQTNLNISDIINNYIEKVVKGPRLKSTRNILDYWKEYESERPELYKLAQVLMGVPATQVSVERLFSGLAFIYNPLRSRLSESVLEEIMLIRSNHQYLN